MLYKKMNSKLNVLKYNKIITDGSVFNELNLMIYLTYRCNYSCDMCFLRKHNRNDFEFSLNDLEQFLCDKKLNKVILTGGEIFIRNDCIKIINYFNTKAKEVTIITNGSYLDDGLINEINNFKNVKDIIFSIDGLKNTHDQIRKNGSFDHILSIINNFSEEKNLIVNTVVQEKNINEIYELSKILSNKKVSTHSLQLKMEYLSTELMSDTGNKDCVNDKINFDYLLKLQEQISKIENNKLPIKLVIKPNYVLCDIQKYRNLEKFQKCYCEDIIKPMLKILPDGTISICEALNMNIGNIYSNSIEIMHSDTVNNLRKDFFENDMSLQCVRCCNYGVIYNEK